MSRKLSASPGCRGYLAPHALQKRKSTPKVVCSSFWSDATGAQCSGSQATRSALAEIDSPAAHGARVQACAARTTSAVVSVVSSLLITASAALAAPDAPGSPTPASSEAPGASIQSLKSAETSSSLPKDASTSQSKATGSGDVAQVAQNSQEGAPAQQRELFDAMRYAGRWYEIASLKKGFAGEGQEDCHCTQGIYSIREEPASKPGLHLDVSTFCVHGSPTGRISGIKGAVTCADPYPLSLLPEFETTLERQEGIFEKCLLRFPAIPFIPPEPYDVLRTDYTSYALVQNPEQHVQGAKDRGFVQIYSRTPNPGPEFLAAQMATLKDLGYQVEEIRETPQDCPEVKMDALTSAMATGSSMELTMSNTMPSTVSMNDLTQSPSKSGGGAPKSTASGDGGELKGGAVFAGKRDIFQSLKDLSKLFQSD